MKSTATRLTLVLLAAFLAQAPAQAKKAKDTEAGATGATVVTVNGVAVPQARADFMLEQMNAQAAQAKAQGQQVPGADEMRGMVKDELVNRELLSQVARAKGFEKNAEYLKQAESLRMQMELTRQSLLINAYLQDYSKTHPVTDAAIKAEYDKFIAAQKGAKEYKARHILVDKEDEAKDIIARLDKGEKFDTLATQSKDPGSKDKGGELDWAVPGTYVKEFGDALTTLNKGSYTTKPVKTQFGYHVIKLEDTREAKVPTLDDLKPQIQQSLQQRMLQQHVGELRQKAKVQ